jgi:hypothetical protein
MQQGLDLAFGHRAAADHAHGTATQVGEQGEQGSAHGAVRQERVTTLRAAYDHRK